MERAAVDALSRGWAVVPVRVAGKRPLVAWAEFQRRRPKLTDVREWFRRRPTPNLGVITGSVSGLVVLDVDPRHGGDESLASLESAHGPLPLTVEARTGGGGRHLYFRHPDGDVRNRVGLAPGLDLRGDGGLVVAPPSVHPSGARYAWRAGRAPDDVHLALPPHWLLREGAPDGTAGRSAEHWSELVGSPVEEGRRNATLASLAGHLLARGLEADVVLELLLCWNGQRCRPPLPDEEVAATVGSIARAEQRHHPDRRS